MKRFYAVRIENKESNSIDRKLKLEPVTLRQSIKMVSKNIRLK